MFKKAMERITLSLIIGIAMAILSRLTAQAATTLPDDVYVKQAKNNSCTLASVTMMLRARAYQGGVSYSDITEADVGTVAWSSGGLRFSFSYTNGDRTFQVNDGTFIDRNDQCNATLNGFKSLLDNHPEGVVLYAYVKGTKKQHAVFLTDYEGDTLYCADPANSVQGGRIRLEDSYLKNFFGDQDGIIRNARMYWTITSTNVPAAKQQGQLIKDGVYIIATKLDDDYVLDVEGASRAEGANIHLSRSNGRKAQEFQVVHLGNNYYEITNRNSYKNMDAEYGGTTSNTNVWQFGRNGTDAQTWKIEDAGDGHCFIRNKKSGLYLDVDNAYAASGTNVKLFERNDLYDAQEWRFIPEDQLIIVIDDEPEAEEPIIITEPAPSDREWNAMASASSASTTKPTAFATPKSSSTAKTASKENTAPSGFSGGGHRFDTPKNRTQQNASSGSSASTACSGRYNTRYSIDRFCIGMTQADVLAVAEQDGCTRLEEKTENNHKIIRIEKGEVTYTIEFDEDETVVRIEKKESCRTETISFRAL